MSMLGGSALASIMQQGGGGMGGSTDSILSGLLSRFGNAKIGMGFGPNASAVIGGGGGQDAELKKLIAQILAQMGNQQNAVMAPPSRSPVALNSSIQPPSSMRFPGPIGL